MLDQKTRMIILELSRKGHGIRAIARALAISRNTVKAVLMSGTDEVPQIDRAEKADPLRDRILDLYARCEGNRIRVHEELLAQGATLGYSTLTAWLKRQGIGETPKPPAGQYHFSPGEEMQHDTSPFQAPIGGVPKVVQIASEVLCYIYDHRFRHGGISVEDPRLTTRIQPLMAPWRNFSQARAAKRSILLRVLWTPRNCTRCVTGDTSPSYPRCGY